MVRILAPLFVLTFAACGTVAHSPVSVRDDADATTADDTAAPASDANVQTHQAAANGNTVTAPAFAMGAPTANFANTYCDSSLEGTIGVNYAVVATDMHNGSYSMDYWLMVNENEEPIETDIVQVVPAASASESATISVTNQVMTSPNVRSPWYGTVWTVQATPPTVTITRTETGYPTQTWTLASPAQPGQENYTDCGSTPVVH